MKAMIIPVVKMWKLRHRGIVESSCGPSHPRVMGPESRLGTFDARTLSACALLPLNSKACGSGQMSPIFVEVSFFVYQPLSSPNFPDTTISNTTLHILYEIWIFWFNGAIITTWFSIVFRAKRQYFSFRLVWARLDSALHNCDLVSRDRGKNENNFHFLCIWIWGLPINEQYS